MMDIERRKHKRFPLVLGLRLASASGKSEVRLSDLSLGGCYIDSIGQMTIGEEVSFEIDTPLAHLVPFRGTVTYSDPGFGFGVQFTPLNGLQQLVVANLVKRPSSIPIPAEIFH